MTTPFRNAALVGYKAASDLAAKGAFFLLFVLAARRLPMEAFGVLSLASTAGWFIALVTDLGLQLYLAREVARAPTDAAAILRALLRLRLRACAVAAVAIGLVVAMWAPRADVLPVIVIMLAWIASALVEFLNYGYRGLSRSDLESSLNLAQRVITLVIGAAALWLAPRLDVFAIALLIPPVAVFAYSRRLIGRMTNASLRVAGSWTMSRIAWRRDVLPIGLATVLGALYFRVDVFLLGIWSTVDVVAHYNAVFRLVEALRLFPAAVLAVLLPSIFRRTDTAFVWRLSVGLTMFGLLVAAVLYPNASLLVSLAYGPRYAAAAPVLQVLLLAFPLFSLNYGLTHHVLGWNGQRIYVVICAVALAVNVGVNAWLIPTMAAMGAAWATLGTEVFLTIACVGALIVLRRGPVVMRERAPRILPE